MNAEMIENVQYEYLKNRSFSYIMKCKRLNGGFLQKMTFDKSLILQIKVRRKGI